MTLYELIISIVGQPTDTETQAIIYVIASSLVLYGIKCIYNLIFNGLFNIK